MKKVIFLLGFVSFVAPLSAQEGASLTTIPQISITTRGEVSVVPDRASIQMGVQSRAATASAAASENARKQSAVISALKELGIDARDITTTGYTVYPEQRYEPDREPIITGYSVTNTVAVQLNSIALVGRAIDAALSKGANAINSLQYFSSNSEAARRQAIAIAVQRARSDAEAAADAAGGTVGGLLEITVGAYFAPPPRPVELKAAMASSDDATPVTPGEQKVTVEVSTRWRFASK